MGQDRARYTAIACSGHAFTLRSLRSVVRSLDPPVDRPAERAQIPPESEVSHGAQQNRSLPIDDGRNSPAIIHAEFEKIPAAGLLVGWGKAPRAQEILVRMRRSQRIYYDARHRGGTS